MLYLLFVIIVVGAGQKMPKNELRDIHLLLFMNFNRNTIAVVPYTDRVVLLKHQSRHDQMQQITPKFADYVEAYR